MIPIHIQCTQMRLLKILKQAVGIVTTVISRVNNHVSSEGT
jgi:hypothetical protein